MIVQYKILLLVIPSNKNNFQYNLKLLNNRKLHLLNHLTLMLYLLNRICKLKG
jgi:hypothetical protein